MGAYQKQANLHDPDNGIYGDCYRTCLAGMLGFDRDSVPHFVTTMDPEKWESEVQPKYDAWLLERGLQELAINLPGDVSVDDVLAWQKARSFIPTVSMLVGKSLTGCNHSVLVSEGKIIHDPSITDAGIIGPTGDGFYWLIWLIPAMQAITRVK